MAPKIVTKSYFPSTLHIDGVSIDVRVTRLTNDQHDEFLKGFSRWMDPRGSEPVSDEAESAALQTDRAWMVDALTRYLQIEPGQMEHEGAEVTSGGELITIYGFRRSDVIAQALLTIIGENSLKEAQKKTYASALALWAGSGSEPQVEVTGPAPVSIAAPANESASASVEAATA